MKTWNGVGLARLEELPRLHGDRLRIHQGRILPVDGRTTALEAAGAGRTARTAGVDLRDQVPE